MNLLSNWYSEEEINQFVHKSEPNLNGKLELYKGEEDAGWVKLYFKYNETDFNVLITLATSDLTDVVVFFESIINLKEETAVFLDNELISTPLLYASPVDEQKIRFLVADRQRVHDLWHEGKISDEEYDSKGIFGYDIRCDVIVEKKKLLKEFYRAIKNIIKTCRTYEDHIYDINYTQWKDNLRNIINYLKNCITTKNQKT